MRTKKINRLFRKVNIIAQCKEKTNKAVDLITINNLIFYLQLQNYDGTRSVQNNLKKEYILWLYILIIDETSFEQQNHIQLKLSTSKKISIFTQPFYCKNQNVNTNLHYFKILDKILPKKLIPNRRNFKNFFRSSKKIKKIQIAQLYMLLNTFKHNT